MWDGGGLLGGRRGGRCFDGGMSKGRVVGWWVVGL